jgi:transcriptional regulator with XRE-family HTH domain
MEPSGFGGRLKELRSRAGLTQPQLAERAGVSKATVADLEQGRYEPSWPMVLALAGALGVPLEDLRAGPSAPRAGRGRPRKEHGVEIDLHATESQPLESPPGPTPTKKGRVGQLPEAQDKPKERKARRPRGG